MSNESSQNNAIAEKRNMTMPEVQAVENQDTVKLISFLLGKQFSQQLAGVWNISLNLALRISDLLPINFNNINDDRLIIRKSKNR